jgi:glucose-1-phosphate adenylyltransferase
MNQVSIGEGCQINKAIIAENVLVGNGAELGVGEEIPNDVAPHIYSDGMVTIGEKSEIPEGVKIGKNTVIFGITTLRDYKDKVLPSGQSLIKAGD